ncbi:peptidoglycan DD-metalloendopeptidase family protein [Flavobacterium sp. NST-5]|uniref:Peptidoglycan DD-metalloendopeptidase family protein n=1 Tax=Flavobacterium ichthyis TaxID=2698827 RepID=A0ABW9ZB80_9FLAO|nr:peptidoglycan DD-metalloendopeptidase family protein [Flavobacterium ichthyis]NBL65381.1 peptidoglycan DD-metalloendopeptidase family protein [Flavobacterium ichthyis]
MQKIILTLVLLLSTSLAWSQSDAQRKLEERKAQLQKEIAAARAALNSEKKKEKSVMTQIVQQSAKIKLQEKLIATTEKQARLLGDDIYTNQLKINALKKELEVLKADYAKMIVKSYKSRSEQSRAMFILSSENFLQAYKRAQYMKQYANYRKNQGEEIKVKSAELAGFNEKLSAQKKEKQKVIVENEKEKQELEKAKTEQEKVMQSIKKDVKKYTAEINKKQKEAKEADRQIQKMIREAIAEANRKAAAAAKKANPKATAAETKAIENSSKIVLTPEGKIVSNNFKANRGKLSWPVSKGFISLKYGDQPHPLQKSLIVHCSGVEISTEAGESARAVFEGEVTKVHVISGNMIVVYVQHGEFFTVYQNLSSVNVSAGTKVSRLQPIGKIATRGGATTLKFMIMQNADLLNPESWISR